jgi:hypothetical protein
MKEEALKAMPFYDGNKKTLNTPYLIFRSQLSTKDFDSIRNDPRFLKIMERSRIQQEENKKKYTVSDLFK